MPSGKGTGGISSGCPTVAGGFDMVAGDRIGRRVSVAFRFVGLTGGDVDFGSENDLAEGL